jgi:diguanylate cyclase (GGDEF)-like protein
MKTFRTIQETNWAINKSETIRFVRFIMKLNPLTLKFSGDSSTLEKQFLSDYSRGSLLHVRISLVLGALLYAAFGGLDAAIMPEQKYATWLIRFAIVCPVLLVTFLISFSKFFERYMQPLLAGNIILAGGGIAGMIVIAPTPVNYSYYAGLILVFMWGYTFSRLWFLWASLAGWVQVVLYEIAAIWLSPTPSSILLSNNFFFISANVAGMLACYSIEFYARRDFFLRQQLQREKDSLWESEKRYRELSIIDDLTQLYNSRHFYSQLKIELDRSNRYEQPLTLLLLDLDDFKIFNDDYGHVEGDQVLWRLGQAVKRCLRQTDSAYRYGGEEFTILLPMTAGEEGVVTAERIRTEFKKEIFSPGPGEDVHVTVSIGLAQYRPQEDMKAFVHRVDRLMYQGKKNGKDRICFEPSFQEQLKGQSILPFPNGKPLC